MKTTTSYNFTSGFIYSTSSVELHELKRIQLYVTSQLLCEDRL